MTKVPDKFNHDVDWDIVTRLKEIGMSLITDNSLERGPLKAIPSDTSSTFNKILDQYKWYQTTSHAPNMKFAFRNQELPCETEEYPTDTPRHWKRNMQHPVGRKQLEDLKWNTPEGEYLYIPYKINKQGYRHDGNVEDFLETTGGIMYVGDSHTMGIGMPFEETWTYLAHHNNPFAKQHRYLNMGCPGYGIDSYYRMLKYYVPKVKPKLVVISYPWQSTRTEMYHPGYNKWEVQTLNKFGRRFLGLAADPHNDEKPPVELFHTGQCYVRWYKNVDAIKWLCYSNDCEVFFIEEDQGERKLNKIKNKFTHRVEEQDLARDLVHSGRKTHTHNGEVLDQALSFILERI